MASSAPNSFQQPTMQPLGFVPGMPPPLALPAGVSSFYGSGFGTPQQQQQQGQQPVMTSGNGMLVPAGAGGGADAKSEVSASVKGDVLGGVTDRARRASMRSMGSAPLVANVDGPDPQVLDALEDARRERDALSAELRAQRLTAEALEDRLSAAHADLLASHQEQMNKERLLQDRQALLSDCRQRLFFEKSRVSQLQGDLEGALEEYRDTLTKFQRSKAVCMDFESKLSQLQYIFETTDGMHVPAHLRLPPPPPAGGGQGAMLALEDVKPEAPLASARGPLYGSTGGARGGAQFRSEAAIKAREERAREKFEREAAEVNGHMGGGISFAPSPPEVWARTARVGDVENVRGGLGSRDPAVSSARSLYRKLVTSGGGPGILFEDPTLRVSFSHEFRDGLAVLALILENKTRTALQNLQVAIDPLSCEIGVKAQMDRPNMMPSVASTLLPQKPQHRSGRMTATQPFLEPPVLVVSFMTADAHPQELRLRLPLPVSAFLHPMSVARPEFFRMWGHPRMEENEVAFVSSLRPVFRDVAASLMLARCIEMGGALGQVPGADGDPHNVVAAGVFTREGTQKSIPCLVRLEMGTAMNRNSCRVAIRSASFSLSRALEHLLAELLSEFTALEAESLEAPPQADGGNRLGNAEGDGGFGFLGARRGSYASAAGGAETARATMGTRRFSALSRPTVPGGVEAGDDPRRPSRGGTSLRAARPSMAFSFADGSPVFGSALPSVGGGAGGGGNSGQGQRKAFYSSGFSVPSYREETAR